MIRPNRKLRRKHQGNDKTTAGRMAGRIGRLCVRTGIAALLLGCGWWLDQAFSVRAWDIHGVPQPLKMEVDQALIAMQPLDFVHAWPARLRRLLLARLPDLADVSISRRLPDHLVITARQRLPVALWQDGSGRILLVDGKAASYRGLRKGEHPDLPLLRMPAGDLDRAVSLLLALKQWNRDRYLHLSEWINEGDAWRLDFERGRSWLLPRGREMANRMQGILFLIQKKRWRNGNWRIDARLPGRWFVRKSKHGGVI